VEKQICAKPERNEQERYMKAILQSNVVSLDIGGTSDMYSNMSNFIYDSWNKMPHYALEYVAEGDRVSSRRNDQTGIDLQLPPRRLAATTVEAGALERTTGAPFSTPKIDAVLTLRQREVFELIVQGMSNKEIARALELAEGTVKIHIKALFAKLGVRRRAAVAVAGRRLLLTSEQGSC
jgi:ATP/maltotriose-dependent transcriptional regulator MalT